MTQIQHDVPYSVSQAPIPAYSNEAKQNLGVLILFVFIYTSVSQDFQKFWLKKTQLFIINSRPNMTYVFLRKSPLH